MFRSTKQGERVHTDALRGQSAGIATSANLVARRSMRLGVHMECSPAVRPLETWFREISRLACDRRSVRDLRAAGHPVGIRAQLTALVPPLTVPDA